MKIVHVLRRLSFDDWGGTEQVVWNLARAQRAAGCEVRIFATTALCSVRHEVRDGVEIDRFDAVYPWWPMPRSLVRQLDRKGGNPFVPGLFRAIENWHPDVVHCHAMARIAECCIRAAGSIGAKCVVSLHGGGALVPQEESASLRSPTRRRIPWGKALDIALRRTRRVPEDFDGIVCVGEDEAEFWRNRHPRVLHLPNGVDTALFRSLSTRSASGDRNNGGGHVPRILCVARIDRQKDQKLLVRWLGLGRKAHLRLVGPVTQPDYLEEIRSCASSLGVSGSLDITGPLSPDSPELLAEYAAADAFVLPSRHEPFGIAVLEAWAAGVPVAASTAGGLGKLCARHPNAALSFSPGDLQGMDEALKRILGDESLSHRMRDAGRNAALEYDWRHLAGRLLDFYSGL